MSGRQGIGLTVAVLGLALMIVSLLADVIGIGNPARFGPRQMLGTAVGGVVAIAGAYVFLRHTKIKI